MIYYSNENKTKSRGYSGIGWFVLSNYPILVIVPYSSLKVTVPNSVGYSSMVKFKNDNSKYIIVGMSTLFIGCILYNMAKTETYLDKIHIWKRSSIT